MVVGSVIGWKSCACPESVFHIRKKLVNAFKSWSKPTTISSALESDANTAFTDTGVLLGTRHPTALFMCYLFLEVCVFNFCSNILLVVFITCSIYFSVSPTTSLLSSPHLCTS